VTRPLRRHHAPFLAALACAALGVAVAANAPFEDLRSQPPIHGDAAAGAAKAATCAACHGADGIAIAPTFPNLAGQSATYLYVQLREFRNDTRVSAVMQPLVADLGDQDMRDLAAHFASLPGKPAAAVQQTSSRGYALYHDGDPGAGVPACQGCHGVDGRGPRPDITSTAPHPAWSTFPALAGQDTLYVLAQLQAYHAGTRADSSNDKVMQGVAQNLSDADMQALADYISSQ